MRTGVHRPEQGGSATPEDEARAHRLRLDVVDWVVKHWDANPNISCLLGSQLFELMPEQRLRDVILDDVKQLLRFLSSNPKSEYCNKDIESILRIGMTGHEGLRDPDWKIVCDIYSREMRRPSTYGNHVEAAIGAALRGLRVTIYDERQHNTMGAALRADVVGLAAPALGLEPGIERRAIILTNG